MPIKLSSDFAEEHEEATERIRLLSLRLGLPEPRPGQPLDFILIGLIEKIAELATQSLHRATLNR